MAGISFPTLTHFVKGGFTTHSLLWMWMWSNLPPNLAVSSQCTLPGDWLHPSGSRRSRKQMPTAKLYNKSFVNHPGWRFSASCICSYFFCSFSVCFLFILADHTFSIWCFSIRCHDDFFIVFIDSYFTFLYSKLISHSRSPRVERLYKAVSLLSHNSTSVLCVSFPCAHVLEPLPPPYHSRMH